MNSLASFVEDLSLSVGLELSLIENNGNQIVPFSIRFKSLELGKSFKFDLSRSWKTTQLSFQPDNFARETIHFICSEMYKNSQNIFETIEKNEASFSSATLEIDGKAFFGKKENLSSDPTLKFEVEVMTPDSSLNYGLINEREEFLCRFAIKLIASLLPVQEKAFSNPDEVLGYPEGAVSKVEVNKYERDPRNRKAAIDFHGKSCLACGFNFEEKYGELGEDYIVVHHVIPVSQIGSDYKIDPLRDLVTICANCHAMVHRYNPPLTVEELKKLLGKK
jgi:5-methylcytosine-specific restriction protein A